MLAFRETLMRALSPLLALGFVALPTAVFAHTGTPDAHGPAHEALHAVLGPGHVAVLAIVAVAAAGAALWMLWQRSRRSRKI